MTKKSITDTNRRQFLFSLTALASGVYLGACDNYSGSNTQGKISNATDSGMLKN